MTDTPSNGELNPEATKLASLILRLFGDLVERPKQPIILEVQTPTRRFRPTYEALGLDES